MISIKKMMGLNSGGRTGNRHKTIHYGSTFVRIKCLANSMRLTKKSFLLRIFLSSHSFPVDPSSPNSVHSINELSVIFRKSKSANCSLIAPAPVEISLFRNISKPWVVKKKWDAVFPGLDFIFETRNPMKPKSINLVLRSRRNLCFKIRKNRTQIWAKR